jgi:hypothetical protein
MEIHKLREILENTFYMVNIGIFLVGAPVFLAGMFDIVVDDTLYLLLVGLLQAWVVICWAKYAVRVRE